MYVCPTVALTGAGRGEVLNKGWARRPHARAEGPIWLCRVLKGELLYFNIIYFFYYSKYIYDIVRACTDSSLSVGVNVVVVVLVGVVSVL